jgi:hypothetical protein
MVFYTPSSNNGSSFSPLVNLTLKLPQWLPKRNVLRADVMAAKSFRVSSRKRITASPRASILRSHGRKTWGNHGETMGKTWEEYVNICDIYWHMEQIKLTSMLEICFREKVGNQEPAVDANGLLLFIDACRGNWCFFVQSTSSWSSFLENLEYGWTTLATIKVLEILGIWKESAAHITCRQQTRASSPTMKRAANWMNRAVLSRPSYLGMPHCTDCLSWATQKIAKSKWLPGYP